MSRESSVTPAQQTVSWYFSLCCGKALTRMRTRVRTCLDGAMGLHSVVLGRKAGEVAEGRGDAFAVTLAIVALVTQQCHGAGELACEVLQERLLGRQVPIEVAKETLVAAILAQPVPDGARGTQARLMAV